jgi:hypothetical protein
VRRIDGIKREAGGERFNSRAGSEHFFKVIEEKRINTVQYRKARKESDAEKSNVLGKKGDGQQGK